jgi:hypothetical protein
MRIATVVAVAAVVAVATLVGVQAEADTLQVQVGATATSQPVAPNLASFSFEVCASIARLCLRRGGGGWAMRSDRQGRPG